MKRNRNLWFGALTGSMVFAGCATTQPVTKPPLVSTTPSAFGAIALKPSDVNPIHPVSHVTPAPATANEPSPEMQANSSSDTMTPKAVVAVASNVQFQTIEQTTLPELSGDHASASPVPINLPTALR